MWGGNVRWHVATTFPLVFGKRYNSSTILLYKTIIIIFCMALFYILYCTVHSTSICLCLRYENVYSRTYIRSKYRIWLNVNQFIFFKCKTARFLWFYRALKHGITITILIPVFCVSCCCYCVAAVLWLRFLLAYYRSFSSFAHSLPINALNTMYIVQRTVHNSHTIPLYRFSILKFIQILWISFVVFIYICICGYLIYTQTHPHGCLKACRYIYLVILCIEMGLEEQHWDWNSSE